MRIGIDFDNTIAGYDHLFLRHGHEMGWLPEGFEGGKKRIVEAIRQLAQGESKWMELQATVYGANMHDAVMIEGVGEFLLACRDRQIPIYIISHKTQYAVRDPQGVDLRKAALDWMTSKGFFSSDGFAVPREQVYFEETRKEKCQRVAETRCDHFIDDLAAVFSEPNFPEDVVRILYHPESGALPEGPFTVYPTWTAIADGILNQN